MTLDALLAELTTRGVRLIADDGRLRWQAPKGAMSAELVRAVQTHKPALLARLTTDSDRSFTPIDALISAAVAEAYDAAEIVARLSRLEARANLPEATDLDRQLVQDWQAILRAKGANHERSAA